MADPGSRSGATYDNPELLRYVDRLHHRETDAMRDAVASLQRAGMPAIQVGAADGAAIALLLAAARARKVVEIGTLSGYSALWILHALPADGHLWTLEADPDHAAVARGVIQRAGLVHRVEVLEGPALESLPGLGPHGPFDAVFVDADKRSYPAYGEWALEHLRPGGLLLADNAYLFGYLAGRDPDDRADAEEIAAMGRFHELVAERCPVRCCLPTPDGLLVGVAPG